ncbi:CatA-like O-acetyltransferase [Geomicrobium sp. JCM 19039]|uniref:CatA-like O-acetyltransferase n=1 Tax=Geomicrobium sp. JCM 19039 TaxID=1460636 RepID=UPI00045F283A|nr:chloramphenicol acetyltransferase CAT [Geomicrobium sp. JCM 19039]GAK14335.1 chloramphenicol acetyltransferase [Geomicrobium sp. JCM 19039]
MNFHPIDMEQWHRKEYFNHYTKQQTSFSMTVDVNVQTLRTVAKQHGFQFYPAFIYAVTKAINKQQAFRMTMQEGELGYWDTVEPMYTVFDEHEHSFSNIWTWRRARSFPSFHEAYVQDVYAYSKKGVMFPKTPIPENVFPLSMIPWVTYSSFQLHVGNGGNYLAPIVTAGRYEEREHQLFMPVSLQVHHGVADGYHAATFFTDLQHAANTAHDWLSDN